MAVYVSIESVTTMALIEKLPPDSAKRIFLDGIGANDFSRRLPLHFALPVYTLSVSELMLRPDAVSLETKLLSWQFLTSDAKGVAVAGEVPVEPDSDGGYATSLTRGTAINDALMASRRIRENPDVRAKSFEFRRLRISSLQIDAFWLKASPADGAPADKVLIGEDRVYPFVAFQDDLKSKMLGAGAFLTVIRKFASERQENPNYKNAPRVPPVQRI